MNLQLIDCLLQVDLADLSCHYLHHLPTNVSTLRGLGIGCLLDLVRLTLCETNAKHPKVETIGCLHIHMSLDHSLEEKSQQMIYLLYV